MTIEKLTDEERAALRSQREWPDLEDIDKALRIIDQLTEALAAAEQETDHAIRKYRNAFDRAESAERDQRDRAESELHVIRQVNEGLANSIKGLHKERIQLKTLASAAEREVARLTEALAAVESQKRGLHMMVEMHSERAEASEARVRELEAENTTLRVNNRVLEADNADLLERRRAAESELAALRERVAFAIAWLTDIEPKPHSKSWNALEVLRGK